MTVRLLITAMALALAATGTGQNRTLDWGDQTDGTYRNPVLNADYSDPDVTRVGDTYYMVASDFHFMGMQVLESSDMVNWRLASQIYRRLDLPGWDLMQHYAGGSWAPSIRWHEGRFYVYFCTPDEGLFMTTATSARGPWEPLHCVKSVEKWEDPCPLFDDDGQAYLGRSQHGAGPIIVHRMAPDGRSLLDEGVTVYEGPVAEGTKWLKRDGYYYLIIPEGGVGTGWQTVLRSRSVYGPYERRVVLEQGSTAVNGPHQGALVDTPEGQWWFYHFQQTPVLGRVVHLQPAWWDSDGWPVIGVDADGNGVGEPVARWRKPSTGSPAEQPSLPATSDDFSGPQLGLQWQWNHNPADSAWSLIDRPGHLTLTALPTLEGCQPKPRKKSVAHLYTPLRYARNVLTQKVMGLEGEVTTLIDTRHLRRGASAGLVCFGREWQAVGVSAEGIYAEQSEAEPNADGTYGTRRLLTRKCPRRVWLRLTLNAADNRHQLYYSTDGRHYRPAGEPFAMHEANWKGTRVGLYCYGTGGGRAHFDYFRYDVTR